MFENIINFFKKLNKTEKNTVKSKEAAKERLHLVLVQDRANVSADFLDLMRQEIIDVIKKYIEIDDSDIDVQLTNMQKEDGTVGAPVLHANIPIVKVKNEAKKKVEENSEKEASIEDNTKEKEKQESNEQEKNKNTSTKSDKKEKINNKNEEIETEQTEQEQTEQTEQNEERNLAKDILKEVAEIIKEEENKKNS